MGKSYIENSLKRFLKRKVKITLGVVVSFLITGMVSFGDDKTVTVKDYQKDYTNAIESLKGLGTGVISVGENNSYVEIEKTAEKTIIKNKKDSNKEIAEIDNSLISSKTAETVSKALKGMDGTNNSGENKGILAAQSATVDNKTITNNGVINTTGQDNNNKINDVSFTNNGIIIASKRGQDISAGTGSLTMENNGIIKSNYGQFAAVKNIEITNKGLIVANLGGVYVGAGDNIKVINTGIIKSESDTRDGGQVVNGVGNNVDVYNYGLINSNFIGQSLQQAGENKSITNYGIIKSVNHGQQIKNSPNGKAYNYGLIESKATGIDAITGTGYNYGVVKVTDASKAFSGDVTNKGVVIADSGELGENYKTGILVYKTDKGYTAGQDVKTFNAGEKITFEGEETKGFVSTGTVYIDNLQNKLTGAVVADGFKPTTEVKIQVDKNTEKDLGVVFDYTKNPSDNGLFLKSASLVGYFEKDGVLLNVGDNNLTLGGDTNITAVKGDMNLDVYAVNIGKDNTITIADEAKINGIINGGKEINFVNTKGNYTLENSGIVNVTVNDSGNKNLNYVDITLESGKELSNGDVPSSIKGLKLSTEKTTKGLINRVEIKEGLTVGNEVTGADGKNYSIYDTNTSNVDAELELTVNSIHDLAGNVLLGAGKDTFIIKSQDPHGIEDEGHKDKFIDLGAGDDKFIAEGTNEKNIFGYNVVNAETIEIKNGTWGDWDKAGKISFTDSTKAGKQPNLVIGNGTTMNITLNADGNHGSDFANYVADDLKLSHAVITGTGIDSVVKYKISQNGLDKEHLNTTKYSFGEGVSYKDSPIFNIDSNKEDGVNISLKTASDLGFSGQHRVIYDAYINQVIADGKVNSDVINKINGMDNQDDMIKLIKDTDINGKAYYTAGSVVTKDIVNSYVSSVEDFSKRAGKGQWLAQGKYINSDTEFDGGSRIKGYDGDITGTVGMIEYGLTENTSYGAVFGQGDAEMDINGGGKLDGDNTYAGLYMKHRTANGIELVGNIGYIKSDMDSDLRNDFTTNYDDTNGKKVSIGGSTTEKGTADSSAVVLSLKGRKDYKVTDSVKVQPVLGARVTFINQDKAENPEMNFTIAEQDIIVVEGTAGMGVAKEFALSQGKLQLNAGAEYTFAAANSNNDAEYTLFEGDYQATHIKMDDVDAAENTGTVYAGFDYEHESGVGFNGKYEMMWSDKGDDSRITAGVSYRF